MNEKQIKRLKEYIEMEEEKYNFNDYIKNFLDDGELESIKTLDELRNYLYYIDGDGYVTTAEVIYYSNAIKYLAENDPSLVDSLRLACERGYSLENINSELLASLLSTQNNEEDYADFIKDVLLFAENNIFKQKE